MAMIVIEEKIETIVHQLPFHAQKEMLDYAEFLSNKYAGRKKSKKKFKYDWEGGLAGIKDKMTAVDLQHKAMSWR